MTTPPSTDEWLTDFKARHSLDMPLGADERLISERAQKAAEYAAEHVPARFEHALPTVPEVQAWAAEVIRSAVTQSQARGQQIATVQRGPSLLLLGPTGVGKTHETYGAMRVIGLFGLHARWLVISAADLYARLRPRHQVDAEAEFAAVVNAPLLAVDDLAAAKNSEWVEEVNTRLVNRRYEAARPTLFTSNALPKQLRAEMGERVASRLVEMCQQVSIKGEDRRRAT
ncbi:hypothetical protein GCM10023085_45860 [Actinomadura viridis]|uniref:DNA replication protein DnaC n=1 Tax=Actinomadura viridis TaxID=58110 RepID=A0A931GNV7_9ACTN|nr:ATP-binding protein [Actinomadura viridis]MBG6089946.1 DNA replication protein DnaC [Actinomadura viridis]